MAEAIRDTPKGDVGSLRAVESGGLRQEISDILRQAIWEGVLKPGQRLNEQWLSTRIGVSRPPLREAIRVLEQEGLVESIPRRGSFVRLLTGQDIFEIYTIRCALEGLAAELVMDRDAPDDLAQLEEPIDRLEEKPQEDIRGQIEDDLTFHRTLVGLSRNRRLMAIWDQLVGQIRLALTLVDPTFFAPEYVESTHRPLIEAMRRNDREEVRRLTQSILEVGRSLRERWDSEMPMIGGTGDGGEAPARRDASRA